MARCIWSICTFDQRCCAFGQLRKPNSNPSSKTNPNPNLNPNLIASALHDWANIVQFIICCAIDKLIIGVAHLVKCALHGHSCVWCYILCLLWEWWRETFRDWIQLVLILFTKDIFYHIRVLCSGMVSVLAGQLVLEKVQRRATKLMYGLRNKSWGTGIRGLMRGIANQIQGNQELLVVKCKVGRPPRWVWGKQIHGMWYFPFNALTLLVGWQEGHPTCEKTGCWFVGGDDLTGAFTTYDSSCHHCFYHPLLQ